MKTKLVLMLTILLIFSVCTNEEITIIATESANDRFLQSMDWNHQHPFREIAITLDDYFILSMSDSHVGSTKNLDKFCAIAKTTKACAIVMVGDLTTGYSKDYNEFEKHLPNRDSIPQFLIAGNHDEFYNGWKEFYARFGSSTYYFSVKTPDANDLFFCLDTGGGTLGNIQLQWLEDNLKTMRQGYRYCFVFTHNNLFRARHTLSTNPPVEEVHTLIELFTKYHVDMVITGHDHVKDDCLFGITRYIQLDALADNVRNAGYLRISIKNNKISYSFVSI